VGNRSTLAVLAAIAAALASALIYEVRTAARPGPRGLAARLVPELATRSWTRITWRRPGAPDLILEPTGLVAPRRGRADASVVADLTGALELASWRRRVAARTPSATPSATPDATPGTTPGARFTILVHLDGTAPVELVVGARLVALGQTWVSRGKWAYLVDDTVVRALDRSRDELRARTVFEQPWQRLAITAGPTAAALAGEPLLHLRDDGPVRVQPEAVAGLRQQLGALRVSRFADDAAVPDQPEVVIRAQGAGDQLVEVYRDCPGAADPGLVLARTPVGLGCLPNAAVAALVDFATAPPIDRGLFAADPMTIQRIELPGIELHRRGGVWFANDSPADSTAVGTWLEAIAAMRGQVVSADQLGGQPGRGGQRVAVDGALLWVDRDRRTVRRAGEPILLEFTAEHVQRLLADPAEFWPRAIIAEEPYGLAEVSRGGQRIERGELVSDWLGARDLDAVLQFRDAIAQLRAVRFVPGAQLAPPTTEIRAVFDPRPGDSQPRVHRLVIDSECRGSVATVPALFEVDQAVCHSLRRPW
jgi:hypothetical protein